MAHLKKTITNYFVKHRLIFVVMILVVSALVFLWLNPHKPNSPSDTGEVIKTSEPSPNSSNTDNPSTTSTNSTTQSTTSDSVKNTPSTTTPSGNGPLAPNGNFVSNHKPGSGGTSTGEQSVCNTTPGATCIITFTKGSDVKSLESKTADSNGAVYWTWDVVSDAKLSNGKWQVSATATLNEKSSTTTDPLALEVNQ